MTDLRLWLTAGLVVAFSAGVMFGQAPGIADETKAASDALSAEQKTQVDAFLKHYAGQFAGSHTAADVVAWRDEVLAPYASATGAGFKQYFVLGAGQTLAPVIANTTDKLVQVNVVLLLSSFKDVAIAPVLESLADSKNPAVRYCSIRALGEMRPELFRDAANGIPGLLKIADQRGRVETSSPIISVIFKAMDFSVQALPTVSPDKLINAQRAAEQALPVIIWTNMQAVRDGQPAMLVAYGDAVKTIRGMNSYLPESSKPVMYQMLADALANAAAAYKDGWDAHMIDRAAKAEPGDEHSRLLVEIESALAGLTGSTVGDPSIRQLFQPNSSYYGTATFGSQVLLAANRWVGTPDNPGLLNAAPFGIKPPKILPLLQKD